MAEGWKGPRDEQWTCRVCKKIYVVPSLARHCEWKHAENKTFESK